jgi:hypothetical protein
MCSEFSSPRKRSVGVESESNLFRRRLKKTEQISIFAFFIIKIIQKKKGALLLDTKDQASPGFRRRSCASCSTRRRKHPPARLLGNRSGTARVYTDLLRLATRQYHEAASRWLPTTPSSSAWPPGARSHSLLSTSTIGTRREGTALPFRTATGAETARGAALPPSRCPPAHASCHFCAKIKSHKYMVSTRPTTTVREVRGC